MDRVIVYDGALPQTTDILNTNKNMLLGLSYLNQALLGSSTVVAGLACTPTVPASLQVNVGPGSIYQMDPTDQSAYGDLGTDSINILKQGIVRGTTTLTVTPPGTAGQSQVYLVQAILNDVDASSGVLSYYNSANPASPWSGPNNSGASNFQTRTNPCVIALKAGIPATTGTQTTPAPDAGYVGLYAITVANGAVTVTGGNIVSLVTAPTFPTLPSVPGAVQNGSWIYAVDTGTLNHLVITPSPNVTALVAGMGFRVKVLVTNTLASDITINYTNSSGVASTLGPVVIHRGSTAGTAANDLFSGAIVDLVYDGTFFQMANYLGSGTNTNTNTTIGIPYIADSGTANAIVATFSPTIGSYTAGTTIAVKLANTITGACTINANGLGVKNVKLGDITDPPFNVFVAGMVLVMEYDGTQFQIINTSAGMFYRKPTSAYNIYVNTSTGSDTTCDGTSATVGTGTTGPYKTIGKAVLTAWSYAPSPFTITINIAAGTYAEAVTTPPYAGSAVIFNGAGITQTFVTGANNAHTFNINGPQNVTIQNLCVSTGVGTGPPVGFQATAGATILTQNTASNNVTYSIWEAYGNSLISVGTHTFNAGTNCTYMFGAFFGGFIGLIANAVYTFGGGFTMSGACAVCSANGSIEVPVPGTPTFVNVGSVTGVKFSATLNGTIVTQGLGINYFPGNVAGATGTGGQYN